MTALSTQILQVIEEKKVHKLSGYEHILIVTSRIFQQLLLKEVSMTDLEKKNTWFFACAMFEGSLVGRIILFTPIFYFIIQDFLFLDTNMAHNLAKSSRALLQQYLYLAFQYFFMMACSSLSDRKYISFALS